MAVRYVCLGMVIPVKLMVVLGSGESHQKPVRPENSDNGSTLQHCPACVVGGHTAEMLALTGQLDTDRYQPRCYVIGATDTLGPSKAAASERTRSDAVNCNVDG